MVVKAPPGKHIVLLRFSSPVTKKADFPICITGTVWRVFSRHHDSHIGVGVLEAYSRRAILEVCMLNGYVSGLKVLPGLA